MTYSEDSASSAAPFSGDQSIFDHPDVMLQAPTTNERVVDTQSGFLVVIKRTGERLALSCRRRVGTPPTSNILLTQDESLKLSKILTSATTGMEDEDDSPSGARARFNVDGRRRFAFADLNPPKRNTAGTKFSKPFSKPLVIAGMVVIALVLVLAGFGISNQMSAKNAALVQAQSDPLSPGKIESFSRMFVADMLDFNPDTYKISQVQAMSYMSPELLEKYWKETNFPLTRRQLRTLPQGTTLMINKITQEKLGDNSASVDIYADLVRVETKTGSPVHIKLKLARNNEGGIRVLEQEDLTAAVSPTETETETVTQ
jgi:hypothetical protein